VTLALLDVEWDACVLEPRPDPEVEQYVRKVFGVVPDSVPYFAPSPWVVHAMSALSYFVSPLAHLDYTLADLIGLVVGQDNSCRYCYAMQRRMMRFHGLAEARIREIEQNLLEAEIEPRSRAALDFARRVSRAAPLVTAADVEPLRALGWSSPEIRELAFQAGYNVFMNRLMTLPAIPVGGIERSATHWSNRLIAPIARLGMRRTWRKGPAVSLRAEQRVGPWSYLVNALDGMACASALRASLDDAFGAAQLSRRGKALVFAVVAHGLEAERSRAEASALLRESGLAEGEIDDALRHLSSPALDATENALLQYARSTVRGQPLQLQKRTRALRELLSPPALLEAIATAALANGVTRMAVVAELA
jgi:AhpD family alkylhydroperoxidase